MTTRKHFRIASWITDCGCKIDPCANNTLGMDYCRTHTAAPKLAEALKDLVMKAQDHRKPNLVPAFEKARALLREFEEGK